MSQRFTLVLAAVLLVASGCQSGGDPNASATSTRAEPAARPAGQIQAALPGVTIDRENKTVDLDAKVVLREGWLELVACPVGSKEHESVFAVTARPGHVHLALLQIGLQPGKPGGWRPEGDTFVGIPPQGDRVRVSVLVKGKETPLSLYIRHSTTDEPLNNDEFVFAGSLVDETQGGRTYEADQSGNLITLVTFPDDVMTWPQPASEANDKLFWVANTKAIPPVNTPVKIRLRPVK